MRMKKQLLTTLFLLNIFFVNAQNFRTVNVGDTAHFNYMKYFSPPQNYIRSIFIDSTSTSGIDLEMFGYKSFELDSFLCYPVGRTTWLGKKIIQSANGYDYYLMGVSDTVSVNTQANVTDTWHFYNYSNGDYIEATLLSLASENFSGITDNVKTIQLQAKNSSGNPISNALNGYQLKFSENYGWTKTLSYKNFPNDTTIYTLIGHTGISTGYKNFGAAEIYNYDVGDEFHYHYFCQLSISERWESFTKKSILSKSTSLNGDTIFYVDSIYTYLAHQNGISYTVNVDSGISNEAEILSNHWIVEKVADEKLYDSTTIIQAMAGDGFLNVISDSGFCGGYKKSTETCLTEFSPGCYWQIIDCAYYSTYGIGLGEISWDVSTWYPCYNQLVYYKKGSVVCGQPINWNKLLSVNNTHDKSLSFQIFPNPVDDVIKIKSETPIVNAKVEIKNISGKLIYTTFISGNEKEISIPFKNVAKGIYFLSIASQHGSANFKIVK